MTPNPAKGEDFRCPGCSAEMQFDPESGSLKCPFCGHTEAVAPVAGVEVHWHAIEEASARSGSVSDSAIEVTCEGCGSAVVFEPPEVAGVCLFCGAPIVAQTKAADPLIAPDALLPAKVAKEAARKEVQQWLATRWFAPNSLKRIARQDGVGGLYLPFWTYAADTETSYRGERGEHYYETEYYTETDSDGKTVERSRQVQRTRWSPAAGQVARRFDDVLIAATKSIKESRLNALEPWDLDALCPYEPAYLAGFKAQRYQLGPTDGFEKAKRVMSETIEQDVRRDIGGDEQRISHIDTQYRDVAFRHLLLPVWLGAYRFQGKVYQVAVNARTGEVQGERPYSVVKIALLVAAALLIVLLIVILRGH